MYCGEKKFDGNYGDKSAGKHFFRKGILEAFLYVER